MKDFTLLDGGMGHELRNMGAPFSRPLWSAQALIEAPHYVQQAHEAFVKSGAQMITVNCYACVPFHLGQALFDTDGETLTRKAAHIAAKVAKEASHNVQVAGCLPPVMGSYRPDLFDAHIAQAITETLYQAQDDQVDIWLAETISSLDELKMLQRVLSQSNKPCYYSFTLKDEPGKAMLRSGESLASALEQVGKQPAAGVLFNCSIPEIMNDALEQAKTARDVNQLDLSLGVYANSFVPIKAGHTANTTDQLMRELAAEEYLEFVKHWYELGATVIGGCCGIYSSHIEVINRWKQGV